MVVGGRLGEGTDPVLQWWDAPSGDGTPSVGDRHPKHCLVLRTGAARARPILSHPIPAPAGHHRGTLLKHNFTQSFLLLLLFLPGCEG